MFIDQLQDKVPLVRFHVRERYRLEALQASGFDTPGCGCQAMAYGGYTRWLHAHFGKCLRRTGGSWNLKCRKRHRDKRVIAQNTDQFDDAY